MSLISFDHRGPSLIFALCCLGMAFHHHERLKGYVYTLMILAAAALALLYPQPFVVYNGYQLNQLIIPMLQFIMFGMGSSMTVQDFVGVAKMPKGVAIGLACQLSLMPLSGFLIAKWSSMPPEIAAGIILVGCSPSGVASNVISYLAKANLALSITLTAVSTLLAPFTTPLLMKLLAGEFVSIQVSEMMWTIFKLVIFPVVGGLAFNHLMRNHAAWIQRIMPTASMVVIACVIILITASGRDNFLALGAALTFWVLLHNALGYNLGYFTARLFGLAERDCRTIALEVGLQNGGMAGGLAKEMGKLATVGLAPAIFSVLQNITGSVLASHWHRRPPKVTG
nr:bile acid:sodium symporter family protein [Lunatimonas salinarum]